jgi:hypothetical protein
MEWVKKDEIKEIFGVHFSGFIIGELYGMRF